MVRGTQRSSERLLAELRAIEGLTGTARPIADVPLLDTVDQLSEDVDHAEDVLARRIPPDARRRLTPTERAAGVRFADLDAAQDSTADRIADVLDDVRARYAETLSAILTALHKTEGDAGVVQALSELGDPERIGVNAGARQAADVTDAEEQVTANLVAHYASAVRRLTDEARAQGITPATPDKLPGARALRRRAAQLVRDALAPVDVAAASLLLGPTSLAEVDLLSRLRRQLDDVATIGGAMRRADARAAAQQTEGTARVDAAGQLAPIRNVYASELLDRNTCPPCADVDGTTYQSMTEAVVDYPGGTYLECRGGLRCRGVLVIVWATEAAPTLQTPGDEPPPAPRQRGPRQPRDPNPTPLALDVSLDRVSTEPPPAAPADLSDLSDDQLAALFTQAAAADDEPLVDRITAEMDRRDAITAAARTRAPDLDVEAARIRLREQLADAYADDDGELAIRLGAELDALDPPDADAWAEWDQQAAQLTGTATERQASEQAADDYLRSLGLDVAAREPREARAPRQAPGRLRDRLTAEWQTYAYEAYAELERSDEIRGVLLRKDRAEEFRRKYGTDVPGVLFGQPMRVSAYYASEEVRRYWQADPNRRLSLAQYLRAGGIRDRKTLAAARAADSAFTEQLRRAESRGDRPRTAR